MRGIDDLPRQDGREQEHEGHRERLRLRLAREGLDGASQIELLEFLLSYALPRCDTRELSRELLAKYGSLRGVLHTDVRELSANVRIGGRAARLLGLLRELMLSSSLLASPKLPLVNYQQVFRLALKLGRDRKRPDSMHLYLDAGSRLLFRDSLCPSTLWCAPEIVTASLETVFAAHAAGVIVLLFPEGFCIEPQAYDIEMAQRYAYTLMAAGCALKDVVLVGWDELCSLRQLGYIREYASLKEAGEAMEGRLSEAVSPQAAAPEEEGAGAISDKTQPPHEKKILRKKEGEVHGSIEPV